MTVLILNGCAVSPYQNRVLDDGKGGKNEYFFAYGNYCGPDFPPAKTAGKELLDYWPPADDLDATCYAHDYCYDTTFDDNLICDSAFMSMVIDHQSRLEQKGCWNLTTDIVIAFFGKNWGKGKSEVETNSYQFVKTILGIPTAGFWAITKAPLRPFLNHPIEGSCNEGDKSNYSRVFKEFEELFANATLNNDGNVIEIKGK